MTEVCCPRVEMNCDWYHITLFVFYVSSPVARRSRITAIMPLNVLAGSTTTACMDLNRCRNESLNTSSLHLLLGSMTVVLCNLELPAER